MQDVVLVDEPHDGAPDGSGGADAPDGPLDGLRGSQMSAWPRRVRRWWPVAAVVALVIGVGLVVADRRESARLDALADVDGMLAPLAGPVHELWRIDDALIADQGTFAGHLLAVEERSDGSIAVVALAPGTGKTIWRVAARGPGEVTFGTRCAWPRASRPRAAAGSPEVIVCVVVDESETLESSVAGSGVFVTKARRLTIDARSGAVLLDQPTPPTTVVSRLGSDLVTSQIDPDGHVRVTRTDALGAADRWTFTSPDRAPLDDFGRPRVMAYVAGQVVVVRAFGADKDSNVDSSWLLSSNGKVLHSAISDPATGAGGWIDALPGGKLFAARLDAGPATKITELATGRSFTAEGYPLGVQPDDGSLADLLLLISDDGEHVIAYDGASHKHRWTAPGGADGPIAVVDGRIIMAGTDTLQAIDGRTGKAVWTTKVKASPSSWIVTDGRVVLLLGQDQVGDVGHSATLLGAYGLDDGRLRWKTTIPNGLFLSVVDGRLYGSSGQLAGSSDSLFVALG
jgi:outer membrane protein assembly factor BamB